MPRFLLAALLGVTMHAHAQPAAKVAQVGILCSERCDRHQRWVSEGMSGLGWGEGRSIVFHLRGAEGVRERLPALAAELVAMKVDVIVAVAPQANRAAASATSTIPIVMLAVADPVAMGLAQSLARPGGNVTGVSTLVPGGFIGKLLELLNEAVPRAGRIAVFWNSRNEIHVKELARERLADVAQRIGVRVQMVDVTAPSELEAGIAAAVREQAEAIVFVGDPIFLVPPHLRLVHLLQQARIPAIHLDRGVVNAGGLMSYGPDFPAIYRRGGRYVDRILKGANPAEMPIEQPATFTFAINLKTARELGITIPPSLLVRADEIID